MKIHGDYFPNELFCRIYYKKASSTLMNIDIIKCLMPIYPTGCYVNLVAVDHEINLTIVSFFIHDIKIATNEAVMSMIKG
jgi:hypothetical protein